MADIREPLEETLYDLVMDHLAKLRDYTPGPVKKAGGSPQDLLKKYAQDPLFSIFGLDSPEYIAATLGGGTTTSIHRKLGDIYEGCVRTVFHHTLGLSLQDLVYSAQIISGEKKETRSADAYIQFDKLSDRKRRQAVEAFCQKELSELTPNPQVKLIGIGMEVRGCYQTGDSKRTQADEALARHFYVSGILPVMPLFCNQSNPGIIRRYRSVWVIKQGMESYAMVEALSGYDLHDFMQRNREDFREPVIEMLRGLRA